ncbi:U3 small nucleolar RNA-associated protein 6-domain-containing protein [Russula vinacea]|nr:U3 small nucleolar RNA-associated protein 6-domain-containing protein [Russula vinacea]
MLAELKDLGEKGLFSPGEIKQIIKKRTAFETALVRRIPNKNDYLRYAAYEMGLEALRRKRVTRLKLPKSPPSISDYALTRRQFQIFERALQKFKSDVSLWLQYLRVAQRAGSRALAGRIAARAVQLHPRTPALYVLAASHELANGGMGAARVLLQRGLRLNADSKEMWREYVRLELGFVEALRRRWDVLGISLEDASDRRRGKDKESGLGERIDRAEEEAMGTKHGERSWMVRLYVRPSTARQKHCRRSSCFRICRRSLPHIRCQSLFVIRCWITCMRDWLRFCRGMRLPWCCVQRGRSLSGLWRSSRGTHWSMRCGVPMRRCSRLWTRTERNGVHLMSWLSICPICEEWCRKEDVDAHLKLYLVGSLHALIKRQTKQNTPSAVLPRAYPPANGARAPRAISASDAIANTDHRKTVHIYDAY